MIKCGDKFCSNPEMKSNEDAQKCIEITLRVRPRWKGNCYYRRDGGGCPECGGKVIQGGGCKMCVVCGWSGCG